MQSTHVLACILHINKKYTNVKSLTRDGDGDRKAQRLTARCDSLKFMNEFFISVFLLSYIYIYFVVCMVHSKGLKKRNDRCFFFALF